MEPQFDKMGGATKELKHIHNIALAEQTEGIIEQLHERWRQLLSDSEVRQNNLQGLVADNVSDTSNPLQGQFLARLTKNVSQRLFLQIVRKWFYGVLINYCKKGIS